MSAHHQFKFTRDLISAGMMFTIIAGATDHSPMLSFEPKIFPLLDMLKSR